MSEKIIINKRNTNDLIYKLFEDERLDQIVRHFKVIIKSNCEAENNNLVLSQNTENFNGNILYPSIDNVNEVIEDNSKIDFEHFGGNINGKYKSINKIKEIIETHKNNVLDEYCNNIIDSNFTDEEKNNIEEYLNNNNIYIRCGINSNNKEEYLIKLFELYISSYFNELSAEGQNKLLNESLLPMYNDTLFLANKKYDFLINKERIKNILDQFKENNNTND